MTHHKKLPRLKAWQSDHQVVWDELQFSLMTEKWLVLLLAGRLWWKGFCYCRIIEQRLPQSIPECRIMCVRGWARVTERIQWDVSITGIIVLLILPHLVLCPEQKKEQFTNCWKRTKRLSSLLSIRPSVTGPTSSPWPLTPPLWVAQHCQHFTVHRTFLIPHVELKAPI